MQIGNFTQRDKNPRYNGGITIDQALTHAEIAVDALTIFEKTNAKASDLHDRNRQLAHLLKWCIGQMEGESGASSSYWEQFPEYHEALKLIDQNPE